MKSQILVLFLTMFMVACSSGTPKIMPLTETSVPAITVNQTLAVTFIPTPISTKATAVFCLGTGYPGTIHYANSDNFGDGFVAHILVEDVTAKSQEEVVGILVGQWLEHNKSQTEFPSASIKDYTVDEIFLKDPSCDPFFTIVAGVRFSIIPNQIPNDYVSFPGEAINPNDIWWHLSAPFGIFKDGDVYKLRLVFGWGT
jgi:hypothetical protein